MKNNSDGSVKATAVAKETTVAPRGIYAPDGSLRVTVVGVSG